jgi:2-oxoglutarate ferredoxin oxidoreductase subunit beta
MRRNINVKLFVHDNQVYGLTKGQASPTSMVGMRTPTQPAGVIADELNPVALAVAMDCGFVARGFSGDVDQLAGLMVAAMRHRGFSLLDIFQPCVSFNRVNTYAWYRERVRPLEPGYDPTDHLVAYERAREFGETIPTGILYLHERPTYEDRIGVLAAGPLVRQPFERGKLEV